MKITIEELKKDSTYSVSYLKKICTYSQTSNQILLNEDDLLKIYNYLTLGTVTRKKLEFISLLEKFLKIS